MEYMHRSVSITYLKIKNPKTGISICLLPWFLLPDRPYPVFTYIYAVWHYQITDRKSMSQTAEATSKLFGIEKFHKSTVSRSIKTLENTIDVSGVNKPLAVNNLGALLNDDLSKLIPEILKNTELIETLEERYGEIVKRLPPAIGRSEQVRHALSGIPHKYSEVFKTNEVSREKKHDIRKRPTRPGRKEPKRVQRPPRFVAFPNLEQTRRGFIDICRCLVMGAAVSYHRFLV